MIGRAMPYISIGAWDSLVSRHEVVHSAIREIHAVCHPKHSIDEIEDFLLHNHIGAQQLLEYCKVSGKLPVQDGESPYALDALSTMLDV